MCKKLQKQWKKSAVSRKEKKIQNLWKIKIAKLFRKETQDRKKTLESDIKKNGKNLYQQKNLKRKRIRKIGGKTLNSNIEKPIEKNR